MANEYTGGWESAFTQPVPREKWGWESAFEKPKVQKPTVQRPSASGTTQSVDYSGLFAGITPYAEPADRSATTRRPSVASGYSSIAPKQPQFSISRSIATTSRPGAMPELDEKAISEREEKEMAFRARGIEEERQRGWLEARTTRNIAARGRLMGDVISGGSKALDIARRGSREYAEAKQQPIFAGRLRSWEQGMRDYESSKMRVASTIPGTDKGISDFLTRIKKLGGNYA